jgi:thioredoxin-like negative regulator of GroEL
MHNTTPEQFAIDVIEASNKQPVVLMMSASWCGPCKVMKPVLEQIATEQGIPLVGLDAGEARDLAAEHGVRAVPTLLVFKDGVVTAMTSGGKSELQLRSWLAAAGVPPKIHAGELVTTTITANKITAGAVTPKAQP